MNWTVNGLNPVIVPIVFCALPIFFVGCQPHVYKTIPEDSTISYGAKIYVENDGRCAQGEVILITGGDTRRNIPRKYDCVSRP